MVHIESSGSASPRSQASSERVSLETLDAACERIETLEADMRRIRDLCRPGQSLGISDAIDVICDVWTFANESLR